MIASLVGSLIILKIKYYNKFQISVAYREDNEILESPNNEIVRSDRTFSEVGFFFQRTSKFVLTKYFFWLI